MVLEVWSLSVITDQCDLQQRAQHAIYNRMGLLLKSLLSVTRTTNTYKLARRQLEESYQIYYRIYIGAPQTQKLGDDLKHLRVGQLCTQIGTLNMAVVCRTKMTIPPSGPDNPIMLKSDHFLKDTSPKHNRYTNKKTEKKVIDLEKPMRCGALVDKSRVRLYTEEDYPLPELPPFSWMIPKKKPIADVTDEQPVAKSPKADGNSSANPNNNNASVAANKLNSINNNSAELAAAQPLTYKLTLSPTSGVYTVVATGSGSADVDTSITQSIIDSAPPVKPPRWVQRPTKPEEERFLKELNIPFALKNTPMGELAIFYRDCMNAPPLQEFSDLSTISLDIDDEEATNADVGGEILTDAAVDNDVDDVTRQLEKFEIDLRKYDILMEELEERQRESEKENDDSNS